MRAINQCIFSLVVMLSLFWNNHVSAQPIQEDRLSAPGGSGPHFYYKSEQAATRAVAILLHGCAGITNASHNWARYFAERGIAVLVLDSFRTRGVAEICGAPNTFPSRYRVEDLRAAVETLNHIPGAVVVPYIVMGLSHGGFPAIQSATKRFAAEGTHRVPAAAIALYPWCPLQFPEVGSPLLILTGSADTWTPAARCERALRNSPTVNSLVQLHIYPKAEHSFDVPLPDRVVAGHKLSYDSEATRDAKERIDAFLTKHIHQEWP
jgi:dienelactone hydrolase